MNLPLVAALCVIAGGLLSIVGVAVAFGPAYALITAGVELIGVGVWALRSEIGRS